jgi:hypothetical protein
MNITIVHSSRGRPEIAAKTAEAWLKDAGPEVNYLMGIEEPELEAYKQANQPARVTVYPISMLNRKRFEVEDIAKDDFQWPAEQTIAKEYLTANTKAQQLICAAFINGADWVICVADNFMPPADWFTQINDVLSFFDLRPRIVGYSCQAQRRLVSHAIFNRAFAKRCNYEIMYNGYFHTYGDNELYLRSTLDNTLYVLPPSLNPTHNHAFHRTAPVDGTFLLNNTSKGYTQGATIWARRKCEILREFGL